MGWHSAGLQAKTDFLRQVHATEPRQRFQPENAAVDTQSTPFYPGGVLVRCRNRDWRSAEDWLWYASLPGQDIVSLDGSIANIHYLNFHASLQLIRDLLPAYLKFWFYFGKESGKRRYLTEVSAVENGPSGFVCTCQFYEQQSLYTGRFTVSLRGEVACLEKTVQTAQLSSKPPPEFTF